jgi:hypothetical protein
MRDVTHHNHLMHACTGSNNNNPRVEVGHSSLGHYRTTTWTWTNANKKGSLKFETFVQAYHGGLTVLLGQQWPDGSDSMGVSSADDVTSCFPCFGVEDLAPNSSNNNGTCSTSYKSTTNT